MEIPPIPQITEIPSALPESISVFYSKLRKEWMENEKWKTEMGKDLGFVNEQ